MCLTKKKKILLPKRAKTDLVCYKLVIKADNGVFTAPFQRLTPESITRYDIGKTIIPKMDFKTKFKAIFKDRALGEGFLHVCPSLYGLQKMLSIWGVGIVIPPTNAILECVIPKGTYYYKGLLGHDIATRRLTVIKELDLTTVKLV